jgi:hypothetical protein
MPNYQDKIEWIEPEWSNMRQRYTWLRGNGLLTGSLADLSESTELEKQYSKLESKAIRHGKRVVIRVKCLRAGL